MSDKGEIIDAGDSFFAAAGVESLRVVSPLRSTRPLTAEETQLSLMTVQQLRNLWDRYDGGNNPGGFSGEAIHIALNLKGDGSYCAV